MEAPVSSLPPRSVTIRNEMLPVSNRTQTKAKVARYVTKVLGAQVQPGGNVGFNDVISAK